MRISVSARQHVCERGDGVGVRVERWREEARMNLERDTVCVVYWGRGVRISALFS